MREPAPAAFSALGPFFDIARRGLAGLVDGDHYFDMIAGWRDYMDSLAAMSALSQSKPRSDGIV